MDELVKTALRAAEAATAVHHHHAGRVDVVGASEKGTSDFVTRVDLEAQRAGLGVILERHPDHHVLAEEDDPEPLRVARSSGGNGRIVSDPSAAARLPGTVWIVDPLDGTTNFLNGHPMYSASVGVFVDGEPRAGAVVCGPTGERWWAARGQGAFRNGRPVRVSGLGSLRSALVGTGFPFKVPDRVPEYVDQLARVMTNSAGVRRGGSAALDLCFLAQGTFDAFWELFLNPWDVAAGMVIIREAGGVVTRLDGSEPDLAEGSILAANSPEMLEELGRVVRGREVI